MNLECLNDIIKRRLAIHIDISDEDSWNLNTGLTATSLTEWTNAVSDNLLLFDYGLTQFDNGATQNLYDSLTLTPQNRKFEVRPVGYNNATGGTFYDLYPLSAVTTGSTVGNYFEIDGGYLQGFYKLEEYSFEQLPARFDEGVTIEVMLRIDEDSEGIFYYMGARSEDKYNDFFSGETVEIIETTTQRIRTGVVGQTNEIVTTTKTYSGVTTSEENNLHAILNEEQRKNAYQSPEDDAFETVPVVQPKDSINENVIAFALEQDKKLSILRVNENGIVTKKTSPYEITATGWTLISLTFEPDEIIGDEELLKCLPAREGTLRFFVNGRQFWKEKEYKEFFFKGMKNSREKQIGVPYNISFGGGSFGLKHSWHYDIEEYDIYNSGDTEFILNNFEYIEYPFNDDVCNNIVDINDNGVGTIILTADTQTFSLEGICDPENTTPITTFRVEYSGDTGQTTANQYYIEFTGLTEVLSNRDYTVELDFYDAGIFSGISNIEKNVELIVYGTEDIEIIDNVVYDGSIPNEWISISKKFKMKDNTGLQSVKFGILIESELPLRDDFVFFIDNWKYRGSDKLSQDNRKSGLTIEQNFDKSYIGAIQKLRVYDIAFDNQMILHNARIESLSAPYGFRVSKGGRIIYG